MCDMPPVPKRMGARQALTQVAKYGARGYTLARMRLWLFHPLVFYPLVLALAVLVIGLSLKPQLLPRPAAAVAGEIDGPALLLERAAFDAPVDPPEQYVTVVRNLWGQPQSLRIAVLPNHQDPTETERGVEIRLKPEAAALVSNRRLQVEVNYQPLPVNAAPALAVSAVGSGPVHWRQQLIPPLSGVVNFNLPPTPDVQSIGLRAVHVDPNLAYGVEIVSVRITPR